MKFQGHLARYTIITLWRPRSKVSFSVPLQLPSPSTTGQMATGDDYHGFRKKPRVSNGKTEWEWEGGGTCENKRNKDRIWRSKEGGIRKCRRKRFLPSPNILLPFPLKFLHWWVSIPSFFLPLILSITCLSTVDTNANLQWTNMRIKDQC